MLKNATKPENTRPEQRPETLPARPVSFDQDGFASHDGIVPCFCHDTYTLEYIGKAEMWVSKDCGLPAGAVLDVPTVRPVKGKAIVRNLKKKKWELIDDFRGTVVYQIASGISSIIKELGPILKDFTLLEYFDGAKWDGEKWIEDQEVAHDDLSALARLKRDALLAEADQLAVRHRDEIDMEMQTTLSPQQYKDLLGYRQKLRDLPEQEDFPRNINWPQL